MHCWTWILFTSDSNIYFRWSNKQWSEEMSIGFIFCMVFFFKRGRVSDFVTISITYYLSGGEFKYIYRHTHTHTHIYIYQLRIDVNTRCSVMPKLIQLINFVCMCCNVSSLFSHSIQTQHLQKKTKNYWLPCINSALLCLFQLFSHLHGVGTARCLDFISKINDLKEIKGSPCDSG